MALFHKPHTVTVYPKVQTKTGDEITTYTEGTGVAVRGQVTEKPPEKSIELFGVDGKVGAVFLFETADFANVKVGFRCVLNGRTYRVDAGPEILDAEPITAHCRAILERTQ